MLHGGAAFALPLPGFGSPVARRKAGRLAGRKRGIFGFCPSRHRDQLRLRPERRPVGQERRGRGEQPRGMLGFPIRRVRRQARIGGPSRGFHVRLLCRARLWPDRQGLGHEVVYQLVQAGLSAQMLRPRPEPVARVPPAHPQFSALVIGHKPVVRLLLFSSADVARYRLPDHRISPSPHSLPAAWPIPFPPPHLSRAPDSGSGKEFRQPN